MPRKRVKTTNKGINTGSFMHQANYSIFNILFKKK